MNEAHDKICIDPANPMPAYRQLYFALREQIEQGVIAPGMHLPPIRTLAQELGIARNTVDTAYRQLKVEGYVKSKRGSGFVVEDLDFSVLAVDEDEISRRETLGRDPLGSSFGCTYDFSYGNRSPDGFPMSLWRSLANEVMGNSRAVGANTYTDSFGLPKLREQLALWLTETRGCRCSAEQIVIQPGTQPALRNLTLLFGSGRRTVAFEEPGYDGARLALESQGCSIVPIPTYAGPGAYLNALRKSRAKLAFVTPSSQFPLGRSMPMNVRLKLIDWAVRRDGYILEDDYCCELRYDGMSPLPSLQSLDTHDRVIYLGTTSKILSPALRISFLVLPPALVGTWREVFNREFCSVSWFSQEVLARFLASEQWRRYVYRTVNLYQNRHDLLIESLKNEFGDSIDIVGEQTGLHVLVGVKDGRPASMLIELARAHDVRVYEADGYWFSSEHPMDNYVLVGFSSIADEDIADGVRAMREAWGL